MPKCIENEVSKKDSRSVINTLAAVRDGQKLWGGYMQRQAQVAQSFSELQR